MAFDDLLDLRTAVIEHVGRPDIADVFPRLVKLAEAAFNRRLRMRDQITSTTVTIASGTANLPSDYAEVLGLYDSNGAEYVQQPLHRVKESGTRPFYAISGSTIVTNGYDGDRTLEYYAEVPTLTDGGMTDTNWLLAKYPSIYLYGVGLEAAKYVKDAELASVTRGLLDAEISDAEGDDFRSRYSRARVRIAGVNP